MREINTHKVEGAVEGVRIFPEDDPGPGGACNHYRISIGNPGQEKGNDQHLRFQNGPVRLVRDDPARPGATIDAGYNVNGITNEALLAVVIDRLRDFQKGQFSCRENAIALTKLEEALFWLQARTRSRLERGVEGQLKV